MINQPKTPKEIEAMREGGRMLATVLELMVANTKPGITGKELSSLARKEIKSLGAEPAFLGVESIWGGPAFPDVICISISEEVQHGIPSDRVIVEGDLVNFDFGVKHKGLITDSGLTIGVGQVSPDAQRLLDGVKAALAAGLAEVKAGAEVSRISAAIEDVLLDHKLGIVRELVGHGVGHHLHEEPDIPNFRAKQRPYVLSAGQTIAVEPIASLGDGRIQMTKDGWTLETVDQTLAAHCEHTVLVTDDGVEILTTI